MRPPIAWMVPELETEGATNATRPAFVTVIPRSGWSAEGWARLTTELRIAPVMAKLPPPRNWPSSMLPVEAMRPPTLALAVAPNRMPAPFRITTWPFAFIAPSIRLVPPVELTRLTAIDVALGWANVTEAPLPMLKLPQLMIARSALWLTVIAEPAVLIVAPVDVPLVGSVCEAAVSAKAAATTAHIVLKAKLPPSLRRR